MSKLCIWLLIEVKGELRKKMGNEKVVDLVCNETKWNVKSMMGHEQVVHLTFNKSKRTIKKVDGYWASCGFGLK